MITCVLCKILSSAVRELMLVLYVMSDGTAEQNLKQIFRIFDLNNDGKINQEEMDKITKDLSKLFKEDRETLATGIFKEMDRRWKDSSRRASVRRKCQRS